MTVQAPISTAYKPGIYKLRLDDFLLLDRSGSFEQHAKTELLAGEVFYVNAQHRPHGRIKMRLYESLLEALRSQASPLVPMVEVSVALSEHDVPEPDITLTSEPDGEGLIPGKSVAVVIEISDSTLESDLGRKQAIYAAAGVPEYWVADVNARVIHQMWAPAGGSYAERRQVAFGEPVAAATLTGMTIETSAL